MATKLDKAVVRETSLRHQARAVLVSISPATPIDAARMLAAQPERIEFRLKGTQQVFPIALADALRLTMRHLMGQGREALLAARETELSAAQKAGLKADVKALKKLLKVAEGLIK